MEYTSHRYMGEIFQCFKEGIGIVCNLRNILTGRIQSKCVGMVNVLSFVDQSRHPL